MKHASAGILPRSSLQITMHNLTATAVVITVLTAIAGCGQSPTDSPVLVVPVDKTAAKQHETRAALQAEVNPGNVTAHSGSQPSEPERLVLKSVARPLAAPATQARSTMAADTGLSVSQSIVAQSALTQKALTERALTRDRFTPRVPVSDRENYLKFDDNAVKQVSVEPVTTFSVDVDTAAYSNMRRMIGREGRLPPRDAVRIEEMINYFSYQYPQPQSASQPFTVATELAPAPWNEHRPLLRIGLQGYQLPLEQRPAANLVFLVDVSGSMRAPDKLPVVKNSLRLLVNKMNAEDQIALVVYAGAAGVVLEPTSASNKAKILSAIDGLHAGGGTHGSAGIKLAYELAREHFIEDGINRVLIASDGDMNVGTVSIDALVELVERERKSGIQLSTLGFGTGNYNYSLMEQLADTGNGTASYIDSLKEAQKVLVSEIQSTLLTIAQDVKIQIEFNPEAVAEYRLIGYENRMLATEDFKNDKVDAGDIGAGHSVTAFYELTLQGSDAARIDPLRYQSDASGPDSGVGDVNAGVTGVTARSDKLAAATELAHIKLRYKRPKETQSVQVEHTVERNQLANTFNSASTDFRFASAVAGFGQYLRGGKYNENTELSEMLTILRQSKGGDEHGYRSEFISLVELASSLAGGGNAGVTTGTATPGNGG